MKANIRGTVKDIITDPEILNDYSDVIDPRKDGNLVQQIVLDIKATMKAKKLQSLSAPQIGYKSRIFCIRFGESDYRAFLNPIIETTNAFQFAREKCSSLPDKEFIRPRYGSIRVMYMTPMGEYKCNNIAGRSAIVFQHCLDHLDGLLLSNVGLEIDELFDQATDEEREEVLRAYAESLDIRQKQLEAEIQADDELKEIDDAIKFMDSVRTGETVLDNSFAENKKNEE